MAKSTAHVDKLGTFDTFKAPWESEAGADADVDKPVLKKLVYNLKKDLAAARDANEDSKVALSEAETKLAEATAAAADGTGAEAQKQIDKLTKERDDAVAKVEKFEADKAEADLRAEVLGDLDPKYAKYVVGATKEELEESLAAVKEDFGIKDKDADEEDEDEDEDRKVSTRPKSRSLVTGLDADANKGSDKEIDFDKVAEDAIAGGGLRF